MHAAHSPPRRLLMTSQSRQRTAFQSGRTPGFRWLLVSANIFTNLSLRCGQLFPIRIRRFSLADSESISEIGIYRLFAETDTTRIAIPCGALDLAFGLTQGASALGQFIPPLWGWIRVVLSSRFLPRHLGSRFLRMTIVFGGGAASFGGLALCVFGLRWGWFVLKYSYPKILLVLHSCWPLGQRVGFCVFDSRLDG